MNDSQTRADKRLNSHQGFTLIEVMVAMAIFTIGILSIYALQITAVNGNASSIRRTQALTWATDRIEKLADTPFTDATLNAGTFTPAADSDGIDNDSDGRVDEAGEAGNYAISWTITDLDLSGDGTNDAKRIRVQVDWIERGTASRSTYLNVIKTEI
jgi:type IV pilus modification protein PilV